MKSKKIVQFSNIAPEIKQKELTEEEQKFADLSDDEKNAFRRYKGLHADANVDDWQRVRKSVNKHIPKRTFSHDSPQGAQVLESKKKDN